MIKRNDSADMNGTSLQGYVSASYASLVEAFGEPSEADGYKVSSEWSFEDPDTKEVFSLYDYKETALYDDDLPSVERFRERELFDWHIGARGNGGVDTFASFIRQATS